MTGRARSAPTPSNEAAVIFCVERPSLPASSRPTAQPTAVWVTAKRLVWSGSDCFIQGLSIVCNMGEPASKWQGMENEILSKAQASQDFPSAPGLF